MPAIIIVNSQMCIGRVSTEPISLEALMLKVSAVFSDKFAETSIGSESNIPCPFVMFVDIGLSIEPLMTVA